MRGRNTVVGLVLVLAVVVGAIFWLGSQGGGTGDARVKITGQGTLPASAVERRPDPPALDGVDGGGPTQKAAHDRAARDEMRRRILAAWAADAPDETSRAAAREGRFVPIPSESDETRKYLRDVVKTDFVPLAKQCYEQLLERKKNAGGTVTFAIKIAGDEKVGGVIDEIEVTADGGIDDPELVTCMRESFLSLTFRPPPKGSTYLTVTYPIVLAPGDDEEKKK